MREEHGQTALIVVGVDGSDAARQVLDWARRQAQAIDGRLRVVFAWHVPDLSREMPAAIESDLSRAAEIRIAELAAAAAPGVPTDLVVHEAEPVDLLLREAKGADLLVLGSHGHGGAGSTPPGSVIRACLTRASCPVVVVPIDDRDAARG